MPSPGAIPEVRARRLGRLAPDERATRVCDPHTLDLQRVDEALVGSGCIDGVRVALIATDGRVNRGALSALASRAAARRVEQAVAADEPVLLLIDSDGARVQDGVPALAGGAWLLRALADARQQVPLLGGLFGMGGGVAAYALALCDLVAAIEDRSFLFVAGPAVVRAAIGEEVGLEALGGARVQAARGNIAATLADDGAVCAWLREVTARVAARPDAPLRARPVAPPAATGPFTLPGPRHPYAAALPLAHLLDGESFLPLWSATGPSVEVGLGRLLGRDLGVVVSQPNARAGAIDADAAEKVARFVSLCAAFGLPVVTLCDTPGFLPGTRQEDARVLARGAALICAYAGARQRVPLVSVVLRRAIGAGAVLAFGSPVMLAFPGAQFEQMGDAARRAAYASPTPHEAGDAPQGLALRTIDPARLRAEVAEALDAQRSASTRSDAP